MCDLDAPMTIIHVPRSHSIENPGIRTLEKQTARRHDYDRMHVELVGEGDPRRSSRAFIDVAEENR